ncbi:P68 family surface lipoprotein [Mycoplasmopsis felifaucium]|uniref:P80 family lipoprotein n=1 Tax=Mycoplasmopsis felifaucium TaxID=35768 RepID=A0ABZ2RP35_9BACT
MKNKKIKNILLASSLSVAGLAPLALTVACGNTNEIKGDKVIFGVTFSQGKEQWNAISDIIANYNATEKNSPDYLPVELKHIGSGYSAGNDYVVTGMKNKSVDLPSLTVNYGTTIAEIVKAGRAFDFSDKTWGNYVTSKDVFEESFANYNNKIQGVKAGGNYALPLLKSSIAFGIDGPVYKYVFKTLKDAGYKLDGQIESKFKVNDEAVWSSDVDYIKTESMFGAAKTAEEIKKIFGNPKGADAVDFSLEGVFGDFKGYIEFITKAIQIFAVSSDTKKSSVALLGIDDPSGILNTVLYSRLNGDDSKMPMAVGQDADGFVKIDFKSVLNPENATTKIEVEIFDLLKAAIEKGALKIYGGGAYSSSDEVAHKLGSNFGSTAGYTHNFVTTSTPYVEAYNSKSKKLEKIAEILPGGNKAATLGKYNNAVVAMGVTPKNAKYDYVSTSAEADANISKIVTGGKYIQVSEAEADAIKELNAQSTQFENIGVFTQNNVKYVIYKLASEPASTTSFGDKVKYVKPEASQQLGKDELVVLSAPLKYAADSTVKTAFSQGPNLYAIKKNAKLDKATAKFVKYLTSTDVREFKEMVKGKEVKYDENNFEHISRVASYVVPFKGFDADFKKEGSLKKLIQDNPYLNVAVEMFSEKSIQLYEEPSSVYSNPYRDSFNAAYKAIATQIREGNGASAEFATSIVATMSPIVSKFK